MKKISNWSFAGYSAGFLLIISSMMRYFILYPDYSQAFQFILNGILLIGISWLYNRSKNQGNTLLALEDYLADMQGVE